MTIRCTTRLFQLSAIMLLAIPCTRAISAQQSTPALPASSDPSTITGSAVPPDAGVPAGLGTSQGSLTAAQINAILQQRPEMIVELKSFVADQLQQRGTPVQVDSISDEMLFNQIAASPDLRTSITQWMLARGYISQADLHRTFVDSNSDDGSNPFPAYGQASQVQTEALFSGGFPSAGLQAPVGASSAGMPSTPLPSPSSSMPSPSPYPAAVGSARTQNTDRQPERRNITSEPEVLRKSAPYNLLSMRDLYTQLPQDATTLRRFGSEMFISRDTRSAMAAGNLPIDLPVGPDYVLGSGDGLSISIFGGISQNFTRVVDREGKIALPEAGPLVVAGLTLAHAQTAIENALKQQFHNAHVDIAIARLRTVRIYVVGDVQRPGAYDVSSLSTPLNALYTAGGPTGIGSLRVLRHMRGGQLVREIDLYDFLLHGTRMDGLRLESGDTLLIPPAGAQVAIYGMVKRPAIYELTSAEARDTGTLATVLEDAGGTTVAAALNQISVERIEANQQRITLHLDLAASASTIAAIAAFHVKDGDRIHVAPILPRSEKAIYVEGHVVRPGRFPYHEGMRLNDVLKSYQDMLPEPAARGDIIRLVPPDLHAETIQFDVADALIGNSNIPLQPLDTIRILGRYDIDSPRVTIKGEVLRPGDYPLSEGMTAAQLVKMAGGFKRDALLESADLTSYRVEDFKKVVSQRTPIQIGAAMQADHSSADVALKPGDVLTIHQISGWNDIGASVTFDGEVRYPGSYGLQEGERLSSVLRRAGGLRDTAYADGAILVRDQVKDLEEKSRAALIRQIETSSAEARLAPALNGQDQTAIVQTVAAQQADILARLKSEPASGRLVIHISADIASWENTPANIELRRGDVLTVPKRPGFVLVSGQVYNASAITFVPGKTAGWYLRRAGGTNDVANKKEIFVIRANGLVVGRRSDSGKVLSTELNAGDVIVVPQRILSGSLFWRNLLTVAQLSSSIAITAAVAGIL